MTTARLRVVLLLPALAGAFCTSARATPLRPVSFTAISASRFWVLASDGTIEATADGGRRFTSVQSPAGTDTIRFATARDGYAFATTGGPLWETTDGGRHWSRAALNGMRAFGTGGGYAYAVTAHCGKRSCNSFALARSVLGRTGWTSTPLPAGTAEQLVPFAVHGRSLWISLSTGHMNQLLLRSTDAGRTFTSGKSPCTTGLGGELEPSSASVVWAVCPTGMEAGAARSTDGGATWKPVKASRALVNSARVAPASDDTAVFATGDQSQLVRTTDGGRTFTTVYSNTAGSWSYLGFTDSRTGTGIYVAGSTGRTLLLRSHDGGVTWQPLALPGEPCAPGTAQDFRSRNFILCLGQPGAGNQGKALYRFYGGRWTQVAYTPFLTRGRAYGGISEYGYPVGFEMSADGFGLIWESRGTLYVTRDGGRHWTGEPKVARPEVDFGIAGSVRSHGVGFVTLARGHSRRLLETRDYGRTWHVIRRWTE